MFRQDVESEDALLYAEGVHVIPIYTTTKSGKPSLKSVLSTPALVLSRWASPGFTTRYYFLLRQRSEDDVLFSDLKDAFSEFGESVDLDTGYLRNSVIDAVLGLWTDLHWVTT